MSSGFGVGDFVTSVGWSLTLSIHTLLIELERQAQDPTSLLCRNSSAKRPAWLQIWKNLEATLKELEVLVGKYKSMGRNAWMRIQLGTMDLGVLRGKLDVQLNAMNALFNSMSLSSLRRVEAEIGRLSENMAFVLSLLTESVKAERAGHKAPTILGASETGDGPEWDRMKMELVIAGVPRDEFEMHQDTVQQLLTWVVNNTSELEDLSDVDPDDSISLQGSAAAVTGHGMPHGSSPLNTTMISSDA